MKLTRRSAFFLIGLLVPAACAFAQGKFYLQDGDRVVFYGDSITDQRLYTTFTESYVVTRFPKLNVRFTHSGWGGDRVTGGGGGSVDLRLQRDLISYKPTVITIMLGMNDGSYRAHDPAIFKTYASGYEHIIQTIKSALPGVRITVIQPSPFDDVTRSPQFEGGYNGVLIRYGQFLKELAGRENLNVADQNTPVVAALEKAKAADVALAQRIVPDRIHPGPAGHLLMAEALLKSWNAPAIVTSVEIDAAGKPSARVENTKVTGLSGAGGLAWTQTDNALPMPVDRKDATVALALRSSDFEQALDQQPLKVRGLTSGNYALKIDGDAIGAFTSEQLAGGINLALLSTPMLKQALDVHALTIKHNNIHFARWRQVQVPLQNEVLPHLKTAMDDLDALEAEVIQQQRAAAEPKARKYEIVPQ